MAVSAENGVEGYMIFDKPINSETFCKLFYEIDKNGKHFHVFGEVGINRSTQDNF